MPPFSVCHSGAACLALDSLLVVDTGPTDARPCHDGVCRALGVHHNHPLAYLSICLLCHQGCTLAARVGSFAQTPRLVYCSTTSTKDKTVLAATTSAKCHCRAQYSRSCTARSARPGNVAGTCPGAVLVMAAVAAWSDACILPPVGRRAWRGEAAPPSSCARAVRTLPAECPLIALPHHRRARLRVDLGRLQLGVPKKLLHLLNRHPAL